MFRGEAGYQPETTTEEISQFIVSCLPPPNQGTTVKKFNYKDYLKTAEQSGNSGLIKAAYAELELPRKALDNQAETIR